MRFLVFVLLFVWGAPLSANIWHEYGQCVVLQKVSEGAFGERLKSTIVSKNKCVKDSSGNLGGFETRFTLANGEQRLFTTVLDRQSNLLEVEINGKPAMILDAIMFAPYSDCYGVSRSKGLQVHCFLGSGMPIDGVSNRKAVSEDTNEPSRGFEKIFGIDWLPQ